MFGRCASLVSANVDPECLSPPVPYIGLEHIAPGKLHLNGLGTSADVTSAKRRFKIGNILFGKLRPYFRKVFQPDFDGICSTDIWVIEPKGGTNPKFLFYWCANWDFVDFLDASTEGTRMPRAKWEVAANHRIPAFPPEEQRAIARVLGALDDKIELNRRMNETLEAMAQAIFKDWLVDFGPVRAKAEGRAPYLPPALWNLFPDTLDNEGKPVGWSCVPLDKIADFLNGLALQKHPASGPADSLPVIKIAELRGGITPKSGRASHEVPEKYIIRDGDFLFSWSGSLLAKFWTEGDGALNQHLFKVTSERFPSWFFSQWVQHHLEEFRAIAASKATTMGHIQRRHLKEAMTICPPNDVLNRLGQSVGPLIENTIGNKLENRTLAETRDLILPKLMSGKIRLGFAGGGAKIETAKMVGQSSLR